MARYNGNITSTSIETSLYYRTFDLVEIEPEKIDRYTKNFFEVLPANDGGYVITFYKDRQILNKPSADNIDLASLFIKPDKSLADDDNAKKFGTKIAKTLTDEYGCKFDVKPSRITPGYCIQYKAEIVQGENEKEEGTFEMKDTEIKSKELTVDSREITHGTRKAESLIDGFMKTKMTETFDGFDDDDESETFGHIFGDYNDDDYDDDYEDFSDFEDDDDIDIEDDDYWSDAKEINPDDYDTTSGEGMMNWANTVITDPETARAFADGDDESDEINNFRMAYGSRIEQDEADMNNIFESVFDNALADDPDDEDFSDFTDEEEINKEDEAYWKDAEDIFSKEEEWMDPVDKVFDDEDYDAYESVVDKFFNPARNIHRVIVPAHDAEFANIGRHNESSGNTKPVLHEGDCGACDGAVTAGDFASEVPENMGAVVQSDKKDKKYSSVFDEK